MAVRALALGLLLALAVASWVAATDLRRDVALLPGTLISLVAVGAVLLTLLIALWYTASLRRAERRLRHSDELYRRLCEQTNDVVALTSPDGRLLDVNPAGVKLYGYTTKEEMLSLDVRDLYADPGQREEILAQVRRDGHAPGCEIRLKTRQGEVLTLESTTSAVRDPNGEIVALLATLRNVTEQKQTEQRLTRLARFDALTGLPNRYSFRDDLERSIARCSRFGRRMAVLLLDLDSFKAVNERHGRAAGDSVLLTVTERLERNIRKVDSLSRLGGDEFAVIKTDFEEPEHVATLADRLMAAVRQPFPIAGDTLQIGACIGIAVFPPGAGDAEQLIKQADIALYRAKAAGHNNYCFYDEDIGYEVRTRMALTRDLKHALRRDELFLEYQPQVDLADRRVVGVEALLRWRHPELGLIHPAQFLALAESSGQMPEIGDWVLRTACAQARAWQGHQLPPIPIAVNLSASQFRHPELAQTVAETLKGSGLEPGALELEVAEGLLAAAPHAAAKILRRLRQLGVRIAVDDFGTGSSSLDSLGRLPIDKLKIDQTFVHRLQAEERDAAIVRACIALARELGVQVLAEGVETEEQLTFLLDRGCYEAQGFYFCRPSSAETVGDLLLAGNDQISAWRADEIQG